jgi:DNA-binding protein HU-beta
MATAARTVRKPAPKTPTRTPSRVATKTTAKSPKVAATKTAAKQTTVSLKQMAAALAVSHELPKKQAEAVLNDMVAMVGKHLRKGDRIRIAGLGILVVRKRAARMGRNPATGEAVRIKASKKVAFRPAKELKESI